MRVFDKYTERLTAEIHKMVSGAEHSSYAYVRSCLEGCLSADSEIAVPATIDLEGNKENAVPILYQKDGGFWYYIAYTAQRYVDESSAEFAVMIPFVNFLTLVGSNRNNPAIAGIIFNPDDNGGILISLNEVERLMEPVMELLRAGEPAPLLQ